MTTYFTADTHFGFERILSITGRNFPDTESHDKHMLSVINNRVVRNDRLIILGDFCLKDPAKWRAKINCREVWLILGNHDRRTWAHCFSRCEETFTVKIKHDAGALPVFLSHYPHAFWPGSHHGWGHAYGHVHGNREDTMDRWMPNRRSVDVGLDFAKQVFGEFEVWSEHELVNYLLAVEGHDDPNFYLALDQKRLLEL